jgi:drug/metabolite transporter (DMT)-like permease
MQKTNPWKALAWMMGAVFSFTLMAVAGRALLTGMNTFELMLYRSVIGLAIVATLIATRPGGFELVRSQRFGLHLVRNAFHYTGQNLWFYAVAAIPLSQLVALEFTNPIWVALLAPLLLGERLTRTRVVAALIGFVGILIVAQPGVAPFERGHVAALAAAVCFALNTIFTRQIMGHDSVLCVLFWMTLLQGLASLVLSLPGGIPVPGLSALPWILVVGLTGLAAHYSLTSALGFAPASIVAPMEFIRLPVISLVGVWLYGEQLSPTVFAGAALIVAGNLVNLRAETRRRSPA